jgi:hypothetical protein
LDVFRPSLRAIAEALRAGAEIREKLRSWRAFPRLSIKMKKLPEFGHLCDKFTEIVAADLRAAPATNAWRRLAPALHRVKLILRCP